MCSNWLNFYVFYVLWRKNSSDTSLMLPRCLNNGTNRVETPSSFSYRRLVENCGKEAHKVDFQLAFCSRIVTLPLSSAEQISLCNVQGRCLISQPTTLDDHGHGCFLDNGSDGREGGEAAVVFPAVILHGVREVKVAVDAHGNPLILANVLQT